MDTTEPTISLPMPEDWVYKESVTLLAPDGRGNVIASSEPVPDDLDTSGYALLQGQMLASELSGYEELSVEKLSLRSGVDGLLRRLRWQPDDVAPVDQLQLYCVVGERGYTVTATAPTDDFERYRSMFGEIIEGLAIRPVARSV